MTMRHTGLIGTLVAALLMAGPLPAPAQGLLGCGPQICTEGAALRPLYQGPVQGWPAPLLDPSVTDYQELEALTPPVTDRNAPLVALGRDLFDAPELSASGQIACASCHNRELAFTDRLRSSFGHDRLRGRRNAPTLLDKAGQPGFMWDGSAPDMASQALMPIQNPVEMAASRTALERRLNTDPRWPARFADVFGGGQPITLEQVADALTAFQATLHRTTPFDRFMAGEHRRLSDQQILGLHLFRTKARCATCHNGPRLTDDRFHNLGLHFYGREREDLGRHTVTGDPADVGAFRTPSLRHVGLTAPYMHNGLMPALRGVIGFYNQGGAHPRPTPAQADDPLFPKTSPLLKPLDLTAEEMAALEAFLNAL